jgi:hypothetical protein
MTPSDFRELIFHELMSLVMLLAIGDFEGVIAALNRATMMNWNRRGYGEGIDVVALSSA